MINPPRLQLLSGNSFKNIDLQCYVFPLANVKTLSENRMFDDLKYYAILYVANVATLGVNFPIFQYNAVCVNNYETMARPKSIKVI